MAVNLKNHNDAIEEALNNAWLGLGDTSRISVQNPLLRRSAEDIEKPHLHLLEFIRRPENFGFTCKHIFNKELAPYQLAALRLLWDKPFPMLIASRGGAKSFMLGLYAMLKAVLNQGEKIVIVGAAFRQAKGVFEYCEEIWRNAPVLRDLVGIGSRKWPNGPHKDTDRWMMRIGDSTITALPLGTGERIRGQRASIVLSDEFSSIPVDIFETVVTGFAAVASSPIERMKLFARLEMAKTLGLPLMVDVAKLFGSNQTIIAGTPYYAFNHFYSYWKRYKAIIESKGDERTLREIFQGDIPLAFDWKHYAIIRLPQELFPPKYLDDNTIAKQKVTLHKNNFLMEYSACFPVDSDGFYRRAMIEKCVVGKPDNPVVINDEEVVFAVCLQGTPGRRYVMGVDPASEVDNFAIIILEVWPTHRRIVYSWTTKRSKFKARMGKGTLDKDFYRHVARKIRSLKRLFPTELIALDKQGGGVGVLEALEDDSWLDGELPILPVVEEDNPQRTDDIPGEHIIKIIQFSDANWVSEANHGMKKDFEDRVLLFPHFDGATMALAMEDDREAGRTEERLYDTLEDCVFELEELKDELATIVHTQTGISGRDRWDTPEIKLPGSRKGRLRKDRYSALLMANAEARRLTNIIEPAPYNPKGGFAHQVAGSQSGGPLYDGPLWLTEQLRGRHSCGAVVRH